jgi:chemotaxis protein CheC
MMNLDALETDALTELFNVGLHRAAASLSEITGKHIIVEPPRLWIMRAEDVESRLRELLSGELAAVHQVFGGAIAGDAALLIEQDKAAALARLVTEGAAGSGGRLDQSAREVLAEMGNIVLSACLSGFGDMLDVAVSFYVPSIRIDSLRAVLQAVINDGTGPQFAVIVATQFRVSGLEVNGYMIVAVGAKSLERINRALADRLA